MGEALRHVGRALMRMVVWTLEAGACAASWWRRRRWVQQWAGETTGGLVTTFVVTAVTAGAANALDMVWLEGVVALVPSMAATAMVGAGIGWNLGRRAERNAEDWTGALVAVGAAVLGAYGAAQLFWSGGVHALF